MYRALNYLGCEETRSSKHSSWMLAGVSGAVALLAQCLFVNQLSNGNGTQLAVLFGALSLVMGLLAGGRIEPGWRPLYRFGLRHAGGLLLFQCLLLPVLHWAGFPPHVDLELWNFLMLAPWVLPIHLSLLLLGLLLIFGGRMLLQQQFTG